MKKKIAASSGIVTHERRSWVSVPHEVHRDRLKRKAGAAWARLNATGDELAETLRLHHTSITHRKAGEGWLAQGLIEIDAIVRSGRDIGPIHEAILDTICTAQAAATPFCPRTFSEQEEEMDAAEGMEQLRFERNEPGAAMKWADSLVAYCSHVLRGVSGLRRHA